MVKALDDLSKAFAVNRGEICIESIEKVKSTQLRGGIETLLDLISSSAEDAATLTPTVLPSGRCSRQRRAHYRFESRCGGGLRRPHPHGERTSEGSSEPRRTATKRTAGFSAFAKTIGPKAASARQNERRGSCRNNFPDPFWPGRPRSEERADLGAGSLRGEIEGAPNASRSWGRAICWGTQGAHALTGLAKARRNSELAKTISRSG